MTSAARLSIEEREGRVVLAFAGRLDAATIGPRWRRAARVARQARGRRLVFDLGGVSFCDVSGAAFLAETEAAHNEAAELASPSEQVAGLVQRARAARVAGSQPQAAPPPTAREVTVAAFRVLAGGVSFIGEAAVAVARLPRRRRLLRMADLLR